MKITKPGLYPDLPMADYVADPCPEPSLSAGTADRIVTRSPLHAHQWHPRLGGSTSGSAAARFGSGAHALLSGEDNVKVIATSQDAKGKEFVPTNYQHKATKEAKAEIEKAGGIALLPHELPAVKAAADSARELMDAMFEAGEFEQTVVWQEDNGIWCRARPDFLCPDYVVDLKTCANAHPAAWQRTLYDSGHDTRAAFYLRGLFKVTGRERDYVFLPQEKDPPFAASLVGVGNTGRALGEAKAQRAIELWGQCLKSGKWPGYSAEIVYADPPSYKLYEAADRGLELDGI